MCLYPTHKKPIIATHDIEVVKILDVARGEHFWSPRLKSPFQGARYRFGELMVCEPLRWMESTWNAERGAGIHHGLHAYRGVTDAGGSLWIRHWLFKAIIPAGSELFKGVGNDIVANQLMVVRAYTRAEIERVIGNSRSYWIAA